MKLSKREKILIAIVVVLGLGAAYYFYFLTPFLAGMAEIKKDTDAVKVEVDALNIQKSQLKVLDDQITKLQSENKILLSRLPVGFDQPELIAFLDGLFKDKAVKAAYTFDMPVDFQKIDSLRATLDFKTDYANLKEILNTLNASMFNNRVLSLTATLQAPEPAADTAVTEEADTTDVSGTDEADTDVIGTQEADTPLNETERTATQQPATEGTAGEETLKTDSYIIHVLLIAEFYNSKGEIPADKTYGFDTGLKGKADLFY